LHAPWANAVRPYVGAILVIAQPKGEYKMGTYANQHNPPVDG